MAKNGEEKFAGYPLSRFEGMTDEEILGVPRVGPATLAKIRAAQVTEAVPEAEPEVAEVAEAVEPKAATPETCRGCSAELPEGWEYPYCKKCHEGWQRRQEAQTKEKAKAELKRIGGILKGIFNRNPWYDYSEVEAAFVKVGQAYRKAEYRGVASQLWQEVLPLANKITVLGITGYIEGLLAGLPARDFPELRASLDETEHLFGEGKFKAAVDKAYEARRLAAHLGLRALVEEAEDEEFIDVLVSELRSPQGRSRSKKG